MIPTTVPVMSTYLQMTTEQFGKRSLISTSLKDSAQRCRLAMPHPPDSPRGDVDGSPSSGQREAP